MVIFKLRNLNTGQAMPIPPGEFSVGRADEAYIHLEDGSVSRNHAKVINDRDELFIEDLGSANGTAVHGALLNGRHRITVGDLIHVGSVPFRVDPEVAGEKPAPTAGMRPVSRAYMSRETERLPVGELPRDIPALAVEQLFAPEVNPLTDKDAEELNAISMSEPQMVAPSRLPTVRAGMTALTSPTSARLGMPGYGYKAPPAPTPAPQPVAEFALPSPPVPREPEPVAKTTEILSPAPEAAPVFVPAPAEAALTAAIPPWLQSGWLVLIFFLAGLGTGLVMGLYFAKLFLEMGGKPGALP